MSTISVVISAYNEDKNIKECLESVKWVDEIVVIDNSSTDSTAEIAKKHGATLYKQENKMMLNINKNYGFTKAKSDWILNLDADERASEELVDEIKDILKQNVTDIDGYWIPRKNILFGKWIQHSLWWPDKHLRLFRKGKGKFAEVHVHEHIQVDGKTEELTGTLIHENYTSISQFIRKMDTIYTENEVENLIKQGKKVGYLDALGFPARDFLKTFFYQEGYKDGVHGLVLSMLQAFYSFVIFAKLWERQGFTQENPHNFVETIHEEGKQIAQEFQYWFLTTYIVNTKSFSKKLYYKILRKYTKRNIS